MFSSRSSLIRPAFLAVALLAMAGATGVAFAGWMQHAPGIFMILVESGLSWCF